MMKSRYIAWDINLDMKINDVEYQGDGTKAVFYYSSEDRVDFRELIKILAEKFHIRIEMRQIGVRQEAARLGGLGCCGREICCASWLNNFQTVSTSTARTQQLSLNPQKLAGQCGKLKCCLNFEVEDKYYEKVTDEFTVDMRDDMRIECWGHWYSMYESNLNYVVEDRKDVRILVKHPAIYSAETFTEDELYIIDYDDNPKEMMVHVKDVIKGLNKSKIYNYLTEYDITIYANADNISKLKKNYDNYYDEVNRLTEEINGLYNEQAELNDEINRLKNNNYQLVNEFNNMGYVVHYDENGYYSYIDKEE